MQPKTIGSLFYRGLRIARTSHAALLLTMGQKQWTDRWRNRFISVLSLASQFFACVASVPSTWVGFDVIIYAIRATTRLIMFFILLDYSFVFFNGQQSFLNLFFFIPHTEHSSSNVVFFHWLFCLWRIQGKGEFKHSEQVIQETAEQVERDKSISFFEDIVPRGVSLKKNNFITLPINIWHRRFLSLSLSILHFDEHRYYRLHEREWETNIVT